MGLFGKSQARKDAQKDMKRENFAQTSRSCRHGSTSERFSTVSNRRWKKETCDDCGKTMYDGWA